ncbi:hypothetical protein Tcan_00587, partial [Toxocara canis]
MGGTGFCCKHSSQYFDSLAYAGSLHLLFAHKISLTCGMVPLVPAGVGCSAAAISVPTSATRSLKVCRNSLSITRRITPFGFVTVRSGKEALGKKKLLMSLRKRKAVDDNCVFAYF